jgi:hypothetical protein
MGNSFLHGVHQVAQKLLTSWCHDPTSRSGRPRSQSYAISLPQGLSATEVSNNGTFSGFQLKIIQEVITVAVFIVFAITFLKEKMAWNYAVSFALLIAAVVVAFAFKPAAGIG